MRSQLKALLPKPVWNLLSRSKAKLLRGLKRFFRMLSRAIMTRLLKAINGLGLNVYPISDFYSPVPVLSSLEKNRQRWLKPSELVGIEVDVGEMKASLRRLVSEYSGECASFNYSEDRKRGYGPGFTEIDAMLLYFMIRDLRPSLYVEVGSGLSTYYASLAAKKNAEAGSPLRIVCIEPYPYDQLYSIPGLEIIDREVQDVELSTFEQLGARDVLLIDSTHSVKVDGDVPYLFLEVVPRLKKGVVIHVHDIPFPYNVPYPDELYVFERKWPKWPWYFTEAMLLQAFLSYNDTYKPIISIPLIRHFDEGFLCSNIPNYRPISQDLRQREFPPCSIWIERVR